MKKVPKRLAGRLSNNKYPLPKKGKALMLSRGPMKKMSRGWKKTKYTRHKKMKASHNIDVSQEL